MSDAAHNGQAGQERMALGLTVAYDPDNGTIHICGHTRNLDEALSILAMATRELEYKWRKARSDKDVRRIAETPLPFLSGSH